MRNPFAKSNIANDSDMVPNMFQSENCLILTITLDTGCAGDEHLNSAELMHEVFTKVLPITQYVFIGDPGGANPDPKSLASAIPFKVL